MKTFNQSQISDNTPMLTEDSFLNKIPTKNKLRSIDVEIFSYQIPPSEYIVKLQAICENRFYCKKIEGEFNQSTTFRIFPQDLYKVEGGMMYTTAISLMKELTEKGLLIIGYKSNLSE